MQQGLYSGDLRFAHYVLTTDKLDAWRFASKLSDLASATGAFGSRRHVGPFACENRVVALKGLRRQRDGVLARPTASWKAFMISRCA